MQGKQNPHCGFDINQNDHLIRIVRGEKLELPYFKTFSTLKILFKITNIQNYVSHKLASGNHFEFACIRDWLFLVWSILVWPKMAKENKLTDDQLRNGNMAQLYGTALFLILFFCIILNLNLITTDKNGMADGIKHGFLISVGFICTSLGVSYLFSRRSIQLFLIDAGYFVCISVVMGAILASWS